MTHPTDAEIEIAAMTLYGQGLPHSSRNWCDLKSATRRIWRCRALEMIFECSAQRAASKIGAGMDRAGAA